MLKRPRPHAVALRYDRERDQAPRVLAKGAGPIAAKIIAAAHAHDIPLVADPVAADLLAQAELGAEITPEFYQAVAEILAFVDRLDHRLKSS